MIFILETCGKYKLVGGHLYKVLTAAVAKWHCLAVNKFPAVYIIYHAHSTDFEEKIEGL